jgi:hypothetical protein
MLVLMRMRVSGSAHVVAGSIGAAYRYEYE